MNFHLIIPSAGTGIRFKSKVPKQFIKIQGREILTITISKFHNIDNLKSIVISTKKEYFNRVKSIIKRNDFYKVTKIVEGGNTRQDSVFNALSLLDCDKYDFIAIHDAVRPFISVEFINFLFQQAIRYKSIVPCIKINDTVKKIGKNNYVEKTLERDYIYLAQTPQIFRYDILRKSYEYVRSKNLQCTDDSSVVESAGFKVKIVDGDVNNIKITTISDLKLLPMKSI